MTGVVRPSRLRLSAGETPAPRFAKAGETPAPRFAKAGGTPAPRFAKAGETPAPRFAKAGETPAPRFAKAGETPAPLELLEPLSKWLLTGVVREAMSEWIEVNPGELYLPSSRAQGADPIKLILQTAKYGDSLVDMPALQVVRGKDGHLRVNDGVTRATRAAKLRPGAQVLAEVIQNLPNLDVTNTLRIRDTL